MQIECVMGVYGRYSLVCESLACFLRQSNVPNARLLIYNQHPRPLKFEHPRVRIVNEPDPVGSLRHIRQRMHALASPSADLIHWWDDDDLYLPWHLEDCLRHIGDNVAWKPRSCWMSAGNGHFSRVENRFEGSWIFRADYLKAARLDTHPTYTDHPVVRQTEEAGRIATTELGDLTSYVYRWATGAAHLSKLAPSGGEEVQRAAIEKWRRSAGDFAIDGWLAPADLTDRWKEFVAGVETIVSVEDLQSIRRGLGLDARSPGPSRSDGGGAGRVTSRTAATPPSEGRAVTAWPHRALRRRKIRQWLVAVSDPLGLRARAPDDPLAPEELAQLLEEADAHAVLPAAMDNLPEWAREATHAAALNAGLIRRRLAFSFVMMLRVHADALLSATRGAPVALVKGRAFAATIYPEPRFRTYTDLDLLVAPSAIAAVNAILSEQGFRIADYDNDPKRLETKWISAANPSLMVEVHTNMVHHPGLREKISLTYDDFDGDFVSPASMLTIAAIHGALHQFERLQQAVDVRQAARALTSAKDEERFLQLITRCGGRLAAVVALELAERLFAEPRCREIRSSLGPERSSGLARLLLSPTTVVSAKSADRSLYSWRRNAVRELLKRRCRTP